MARPPDDVARETPLSVATCLATSRLATNESALAFTFAARSRVHSSRLAAAVAAASLAREINVLLGVANDSRDFDCERLFRLGLLDIDHHLSVLQEHFCGRQDAGWGDCAVLKRLPAVHLTRRELGRQLRQ
jgi:hypothetical protein